jgi:hypothetical protein
MNILKYPPTCHIEGSRLQQGDDDLEQIPRRDLVGRYLVIEEKQDGSNSGISFQSETKMMLQSRGHFLEGGDKPHFTLMKQWASIYSDDLYLALGETKIGYGEWLFKKHTVFYDLLPHYWAEFDVYDRERKVFLDTASRKQIFAGVPIVPVKVLWEGIWTGDMRFEDFVGPSNFKTPKWRENLRSQVEKFGFDWDLVWKHTDQTDLMEGLYIKWEEDGIVKGRYKFVRHDFVSLIISNDEHHDNLPPVPNMLAPGVDLFGA